MKVVEAVNTLITDDIELKEAREIILAAQKAMPVQPQPAPASDPFALIASRNRHRQQRFLTSLHASAEEPAPKSTVVTTAEQLAVFVNAVAAEVAKL